MLILLLTGLKHSLTLLMRFRLFFLENSQSLYKERNLIIVMDVVTIYFNGATKAIC